MQSITELTDMFQSSSLYELEIIDGEPYTMSDKARNLEYSSLTQFIIEVLRSPDKFFNDHEEKYNSFVEYCATEMEDDEISNVVLMTLMPAMNCTKDMIYAISRSRPDLRECKDMVKKSQRNGEFWKTVKSSRDYVIQESNIKQYIVDIFRKSGSFQQLGRALSSRKTVAHTESIEEKWQDSVRNILGTHVRNMGYNTCKV